MKKISKLMMMLILVSAIFGCEKEKEKPGGGFTLPPAQYEVKLENEILMKNNDGFGHISEVTNDINSAVSAYSSNLSSGQASEEDISITNIQNLGVGETKEVNVTGENSSKKTEIGIIKSFSNKEIYTILEGTVTREADDKLSFIATKINVYKNGEQHEETKNLTGYIVSDIIKKLGQPGK